MTTKRYALAGLMTHIVDTSVWIELFKDKTGRIAAALERTIGGGAIVMVPPVRLELLQGCRGEPQWLSVFARVSAVELRALDPKLCDNAARMYFDLRQSETTLRSPLDCIIAQTCIDHTLTLIHNDRDFETIAAIRPLKHVRLDLTKATP
jgi:predicted nucleic acid-binding protein